VTQIIIYILLWSLFFFLATQGEPDENVGDRRVYGFSLWLVLILELLAAGLFLTLAGSAAGGLEPIKFITVPMIAALVCWFGTYIFARGYRGLRMRAMALLIIPVGIPLGLMLDQQA
jgi:Na+/proline symporter